ncbi:MAG: hypothetical protein RXR52_39985, partial [Paraburkholderia sp.]|uniref:hypothetical protein n=1 Tax=Paraburkholderia sp. TaxID=1926495 RepID=UPI00397A192F
MNSLDVLLATVDTRPCQSGQIYRFDFKRCRYLPVSFPDTGKTNGQIHAVANRIERDTGGMA